jgi:DNA-binding response OmpR family regulator
MNIVNGLVLVVEDHADTREMLRIYLRGRGIAVVCAHSPASARRLLARINPAVAVVDLSLPTLEKACELCLEIATAQPGSFVIGLNGYGFRSHASRALESGCSTVIPKPFDLDKLHDEILAGIHRFVTSAVVTTAD